MSADSLRKQSKQAYHGQVILPQAINDPSIIESVAGFIHEVVPQVFCYSFFVMFFSLFDFLVNHHNFCNLENINDPLTMNLLGIVYIPGIFQCITW